MEVLCRNQQVFGAQPAAMYPPTLTRMFATPSDAYTCYSFESVDTKPARGSPFVEVEASSAYVRGPTTVLSPPPEDMQTEPIDLSVKRPASASSDTSLSAPSPASFHHTFPPSPAEDHQGHQSEFSLLRNLLSVGKASSSSSASSAFSSPSTSNSDRSCDSPCSDSGSSPARHLCGSTRVTLAKKNMYPVSARVSDWLVKVVQFAKSIPEFMSLDHNDKVTLVLNSWSRLLLLYMAESNFQFVVTPTHSEPQPSEMEGGPSPDEPTMKSVEGVQTFIRKCQHMGVEAKEYAFLRMLVLFNSGYVGLNRPDVVDSLNSVVQQLLQQHVRVARPDDVMHYSRLLMCLPSLYGISSKMVERLFCRHINSNTDMEVLLKELLQNL
nr:hypothetical protein BaRGS_015159 [Batillaria attramentaria]